MVFQDQLLFPHLSALDNVAFGLALARRAATPTARADARAAGSTGSAIGELADRQAAPSCPAGRRSGSRSPGRWRTDPDLLLLDEPFAGLDVGVAAALRIELTRHLAVVRGITVLVTHDALDALTLADRVLVIDDGRVAQVGTPARSRPGRAPSTSPAWSGST